MKLLADGYLLRDDGVIDIDPDVVYPEIMVALGVTDAQLDRYWLTAIYQCAKLEAMRLAKAADVDRRPQGIPLQLNILPGRAKQRWQLKRHAEGKGEVLGLKHAPDHFAKLRQQSS